jgi:hypothetical protein
MWSFTSDARLSQVHSDSLGSNGRSAITSGLPTIHTLSDQTTSKCWFLLEIFEVKRDCSYLPTGTLRRTSSKKLKMKLTLFTAAVCSVPGAFNTAMRLPSGCRSKL